MQMMMSIGTYVRRGRRVLRRAVLDERLHTLLRGAGYFLAGLCLSAASLGASVQPLPLGLLCAGLSGWPALLAALGSCGGYWIFWGNAGIPGMIWSAAGLIIAWGVGNRGIRQRTPLLEPALAALTVAMTGVAFQLWRDDRTPIPMYLLRIVLAAGSAGVFAVALERREAVANWLCCGLGVLALAQIAPWPWLDLGFVAAAAISAAGALPAAALAGLALDLSQISRVPMTAVLCAAYLIRLIPGLPVPVSRLAPALCYLPVMALSGVWAPQAVFSLLLGGVLSLLLPHRTPVARRRGETGVAQVRLELTAGVLAQAEQLLLQSDDAPVDEEALLRRAAETACAACPRRDCCPAQQQAQALPTHLLHRPPSEDELPAGCRKHGRLRQELLRAQEQLHTIRADRARRQEYRTALVQQYRFLAEYLQSLSDSLPRRAHPRQARFQPQVAVSTAGRQSANGDRCFWFSGTECRYYVLLCDGMGTGLGAAEAGRSAGEMLQKLLRAGFPPQYALRSLNSLLALLARGGAVTVDLAELELISGSVNVYKWGAAPSYLLAGTGAEKIGTATPPPGLSISEGRETVDRLSLRRGEALILFSDGVDGEDAIRRAAHAPDAPPGELAEKLLEYGRGDGTDDATAAVIRLFPLSTAT